MNREVIDTALRGETVDVNERQDGVTYQTDHGRVTVLHNGRINVTGDLIAKVTHLGGATYRHGQFWPAK